MTNKFCSYDDLPVTICADDVALVLGISRANAYALMHTKGFPTIYIGKRMLVRRDDLFTWLESRTQ